MFYSSDFGFLESDAQKLLREKGLATQLTAAERAKIESGLKAARETEAKGYIRTIIVLLDDIIKTRTELHGDKEVENAKIAELFDLQSRLGTTQCDLYELLKTRLNEETTSIASNPTSSLFETLQKSQNESVASIAKLLKTSESNRVLLETQMSNLTTTSALDYIALCGEYEKNLEELKSVREQLAKKSLDKESMAAIDTIISNGLVRRLTGMNAAHDISVRLSYKEKYKLIIDAVTQLQLLNAEADIKISSNNSKLQLIIKNLEELIGKKQPIRIEDITSIVLQAKSFTSSSSSASKPSSVRP